MHQATRGVVHWKGNTGGIVSDCVILPIFSVVTEGEEEFEENAPH